MVKIFPNSQTWSHYSLLKVRWRSIWCDGECVIKRQRCLLRVIKTKLPSVGMRRKYPRVIPLAFGRYAFGIPTSGQRDHPWVFSSHTDLGVSFVYLSPTLSGVSIFFNIDFYGRKNTTLWQYHRVRYFYEIPP